MDIIDDGMTGKVSENITEMDIIHTHAVQKKMCATLSTDYFDLRKNPKLCFHWTSVLPLFSFSLFMHRRLERPKKLYAARSISRIIRLHLPLLLQCVG